jgi:hypothetical protein
LSWSDAVTRAAETAELTPGASSRERRTPKTPRHDSSGWLTATEAIDHGRFPPGTILDARYRIVGRLGRGGMGEVYRADDRKLGQPVALKFLPEALDRDPARLTQLHTEVRMARQVSHPNVCRVYDVGEVEGHTFLSMEYVDGEDLALLLRRIGRFPADRATELARQICAGLAAAHDRGVVHRDLKPANIMLDANGRIRITDFGLAGVIGGTLRAGTPAYMAPEQLAGAEVTPRSDIYSLGLVLYELFTGQRALDASTVAELIAKREQAHITPPSALVRDLDERVERVIFRCLSRDPQKRPSSALAVAATLPGGDPLAAALAAGETPSPEMVAAAGETRAVPVAAGLSLLAFVVAGLIACAVAADRTSLLARIPLDKSLDALQDRAQTLAATIGGADRPLDTARGMMALGEYLTYVSKTDQRPERWNSLATGRFPTLAFWYRGSPVMLVPERPAFRPSLSDPPPAITGMVSVLLDPQGRLVEYLRVPPQLDTSAPPGPAMNWKPLFDAAGLDMSTFSPEAPNWTPRVYADARAAWTGPYPERPDLRARVESASYRGTPVWFRMMGPWTQPQRVAQAQTRPSALAVATNLLWLGLMCAGFAFARRNMRLGRADHKAALRLAWFTLLMFIGSWVIGARHYAQIDLERQQALYILPYGMFGAGLLWVFYVALEPFVRRYWPEILISWTRLLGGQTRDPRVGRDLLVGTAVGVALALLNQAFFAIAPLSGRPPVAPRTGNLEFMLGAPAVVSYVLRVVPNALQNALFATFLFVVLRATLRRTWLAVLVSLVVFGLFVMAESNRDWLALTAFFALMFVGALIATLLAFGLVAQATAFLVNQVLNNALLTANFSQPYAATSAWLLAGCFVLALFGFYASRAGQPLLGSLLPRD